MVRSGVLERSHSLAEINILMVFWEMLTPQNKPQTRADLVEKL